MGVKHEYNGRKSSKEVEGVTTLRIIPCAFGCGFKSRTVEAIAMHEKTSHAKLIKRLMAEKKD